MIRTVSHVTFASTLVIASILTGGLSQGDARPEPSARHIQVHKTLKAAQRVAIHLASRLQNASFERPIHLVKDATIENLRKLRNVSALAPQEPVYQSASKEDGDGAGEHAELKVTPVVGDIMNKIRPKQITGMITIEGKEYQFGSGGLGQSIPYGDYLITPDAVGSWGAKHEAIGVANGSMPDPKLHRDRDGIELHAATNGELKTHGCVSIRKDQWPEFRNQVLAMVRENKNVYLHVSDQGAWVSADPFGFIGETISQPTFSDVLSLLEQPVRKAPEITPSSRCCRLIRVKTKHAHGIAPTPPSRKHLVNRRRA